MEPLWQKSLIRLVAGVVVLFSLAACGTAVDPNSPKFLSREANLPPEEFDARVEEFTNDFLATADEYGLDARGNMDLLRQVRFAPGLVEGNVPPVGPVRFNEPGGLLGICISVAETNTINNKKFRDLLFVYFDDRFVERLESYTFKALVYHELGHCLLGADHTEWSDSPIPSVDERIVAALAAAGIEGVAPADPTEERWTEEGDGTQKGDEEEAERHYIFRGLLYPESVMRPIAEEATASYKADRLARYHIMAPYLVDDDVYWQENWDFLVDDFFTRLGGAKS